jgi:hypothetical protein
MFRRFISSSRLSSCRSIYQQHQQHQTLLLSINATSMHHRSFKTHKHHHSNHHGARESIYGYEEKHNRVNPHFKHGHHHHRSSRFGHHHHQNPPTAPKQHRQQNQEEQRHYDESAENYFERHEL